MIAVATGFAAGLLHVFVGVDHLAALAPIAGKDPARATRTGAKWGFGHGLGVLIVGEIGLAFRSTIDVEAVSAWAEVAVGFMLIAIGFWAVQSTSGDVDYGVGADDIVFEWKESHPEDEATLGISQNLAESGGVLHGPAVRRAAVVPLADHVRDSLTPQVLLVRAD